MLNNLFPTLKYNQNITKNKSQFPKNIFNFLLTQCKYNSILTLTLENESKEIKIIYIKRRNDFIMKREEMITSMAELGEMTKKLAEQALDAFLLSVEKALGNGEEVKLNNYVILTPTVRKERNGRNPQNGEPITIPASNFVKTKIGKKWDDAVAGIVIPEKVKKSRKKKDVVE